MLGVGNDSTNDIAGGDVMITIQEWYSKSNKL